MQFERECFIKIVWFYFAENEPANLNCEQKMLKENLSLSLRKHYNLLTQNIWTSIKISVSQREIGFKLDRYSWFKMFSSRKLPYLSGRDFF